MIEQNSNRDRWMRMHADPDMREKLSKHLRESWEKSDACKVDYLNALPEKISSGEFAKIKIKNRRLYIYTNSVIDFPLSQIHFPECGVLLFDKTGCLLQLYGNNEFLSWAADNHIKIGTRWTEKTIGTNAVSLGMMNKETVSLRGEENYSEFLTGGIFSYTPIKLDDGELLGGIVLAAPSNTSVKYLRPLSFMVAREVELQIFWFETISKYSNMTENVGLMCLDQSNKTNRIIIMNNETIRMLGVPKKDYFYDKLENVIEVDDNNKPFWDIINNKKKVLDKTISLSVNGKQVVVNLSTAAFKEDKFHINGVIIYIQSIKRINKLVSQYSGNIARLNFSDIIGESEIMTDVVRRATTAAMTDANILILGESGVGKDVFAQAIHNSSARKNKPYVAINCAAFSKELIASELFGYESGAFTGAKKEGRIGKFELANQGTLFLDEIGDMPLDLQAILLRVLEEQCFRKVGGNTLVNVNVRIIAATNSNLKEKIASGLFREDLFYRLGVIRLHVPPLSDRGDDVRLLAEHFINHICSRLDKPMVTFSSSAIAFIRRYAWPGNVRELQNLLEGIISTSTGTLIDETNIRNYLGDFSDERITQADVDLVEAENKDEFIYDERSEFLKALKRFNNNKTKAAAYLDMPLSTFYRRLKKHAMI